MTAVACRWLSPSVEIRRSAVDSGHIAVRTKPEGLIQCVSTITRTVHAQSDMVKAVDTFRVVFGPFDEITQVLGNVLLYLGSTLRSQSFSLSQRFDPV